MHLAQGEVVEPKGQARGGIGIVTLLMGQGDVEADARRSGVMGPAIGRFHDPRATAGGDDIVTIGIEGAPALGGDARETPRRLIVGQTPFQVRPFRSGE